MGLTEPLLNTLQKLQFQTPTPIQVQAIPLALEGKDILGSAQTGTGKTAAFGIPLVTRLSTGRGSALVMTPTRELAIQVSRDLQQLFGDDKSIKTALLIGGEPMPQQNAQLRKRPRLIVGTPGRINDHLDRGTLMLHDTGFLVLEETDRMLDMGFSTQIDAVMKFMTSKRQTLLFSATIPKDITRMASKYLDNPVRVAVGGVSKPAANIKQESVHITAEEKYPRLLKEIEARSGSIIVFMKTKYATEKLAVKLNRQGHAAEAIHGDLKQSRRTRVLAEFRNKKHRILVATDVAARGLDIPHIEHVINYDLPMCAEDYIHRIGRTARAGADGNALNLIAPSDHEKWDAIRQLLDPDDWHPAAKPAQKAKKSRHKPKHAGASRPQHARGSAAGASKEGTSERPPRRRRNRPASPQVQSQPAAS